MAYKHRKYNIKMVDLAKIFNYSSPQSLYSSKGKDKLIKSVSKLLTLLEDGGYLSNTTDNQ